VRRHCLIVLLIIPGMLFCNTYGLGVIIGSPTGFTGKCFLSRISAVQINAGWSFIGDVGFHLTGDYQFLFPGIVADDYGRPMNDVVPYIGIGGRLRVKENEQTNDTDLHIGMRIGGGIEYMFERFGLFLELYPVIDFVPETNFDFEGGLGFRFYF
jgi:hypothetical protein